MTTTSAPRWRLHRGGIVNIWQFGEQVFDYSDGRVFLQGANGSGKSRTLELLLPLCLDGDFHHMGAKGYDSVSIRRLMLDDYSGGPNRIGYTWIELRRATADGGEEFLTSGVGVKASRATQGITGSWFFMTPLRIGIDFELLSADKVPLDQKDLRERIGADAVMTDHKLMQQKAAAAVYGIEDQRRYEDLLHLLRTLRNPDVGVRAVEGQLEKYLSMALPPLDPDVTRRLAVQFQDLEAIRESFQRLTLAQKALSKFLLTYRQYATRVTRERASAVITARTALATHLHAAAERAQNLVTERTARDNARETLKDLAAQEGTLQSEVDELSKSPEYSDISARRRDVERQRQLATALLDQAEAHRTAENTAAEGVRSALQQIQQDARAANRAADEARERLVAAGMAVALLPVLPAIPETQLITRTEQVPVSVSPSDPPAEITRLEPPVLDISMLTEAIQDAASQSERAHLAGREHRVTASHLQKVAKDLEDKHERIRNLRTKAQNAAEAARAAAERRRAVATESASAAQDWLSQVHEWLAAVPDSGALAVMPPALLTAADLVSSAGQADSIRERCQDWSLPAIREAHAALAAADWELRSLEGERKVLSAELDARHAGADLDPPLPPHAAPSRTARPGAPFYRLVDFGPSLGAQERAGLEAALQGSGLLNAWVTPDGRITDPDLQDLIATPVPAQADNGLGETLLAVLTPNADPGSEVAPETVARLLASVRLADNPALEAAGGLVLSRVGRWRAGPLTGAWEKETADHVGPAARRSSRLRRITALEDLLKEWQASRDVQELRLDAARASVAAWEKHTSAFPAASAVAVAHSQLETARAAEAATSLAASAAARAHAAADGLWQAENATFARQARDAGLPVTSTTLTERLGDIQRAIDAITTLTSSLSDRCLAAVTQMARPLADLANAADARRKSEAAAQNRRDEYASAKQTLALHIEALGFDSQEFDTRLSLLNQQLDLVRKKIPEVRGRHERAEKAVIRITALQEDNEKAEQDKRQEASTQEARLDSTLAVPGLWAAASDGQPPPPDRDAALQAATSWPADDTSVSQVELVGAFQSLTTALPPGHHARIDGDDSTMAILVSDGEASHPVVAAVARTNRRIAEHEEQLNERYQDIFEDFLLRDLADRLRQQIDAADLLCHAMNAILARAQSSQGIRVELSWDPSPNRDQATRDALAIVRTSFATRSPDQGARLRTALREVIEAERDKGDAHYADVLTRALDYRDWYTFTVRVRDNGPDGQPRNRALRRLSSGETRVASYVTLFAAVAAFYDALDTAGSTPLRLVLLDEAFDRVDDPTKTRLLTLLASLDIDWVITWPGGSVLSSHIGLMHIYNIFRPAAAPGMAFVHLTWDGIEAKDAP